MKLSFDLNSMKEFGTEHVEKFVFGLVVLLLLFFAVGAVGTVSRGRPSFTPDELTGAAKSAEDGWKNTDPEEFARAHGIIPHDYYKDHTDTPMVPTEPYELKTVWDIGPFGERGKRGLPGVLSVESLVATAGHGAVSMSSGFGGRMANRGGELRGQRWVVITGLLPIKSQMDAYELAFESALFRDPRRDVPIYIGYHVERREVNASGEAGQADWRRIKLLAAFQAAGYRGGRGSQEVVHQRFLPLQLRGTPPMAFPLLALTSTTWGAEAAHPPEIPLLIDMPRMERRAVGPSAEPEGVAGEGEDDQESEGEDTGGFGEFGGFGGFTGTGGPRMGGEEGFGMEGAMGPGMEGMGSTMGAGAYTGAAGGSSPYGGGSNPYGGASANPYGGSGGSMYGGSASPYGTGMGGVRGLARIEKPLEYQLFRFLDVTVEPGKRYQYRVQIGLANPNYKVNARFLENVALAKSMSIAAEWSDPTNVVVVPRDSRLLAGSVKPPGGTLPTSIMYEPTCKVMAVTIRMEDGLEAAHEITAYRGQLGDFVSTLAQETGPAGMYGAASGMYGMGEYGGEEADMESAMEGMMEPGGMPMPGRPAAKRGDDDEEAEEISHATGMLLLDMVGGERLHGTDRSLVEPGTLLLLDPDGNLMIHDELDDQEEFLVYHVPEEKKPKRSRKKDDRMPPGYDPAGGGSGGMEEMYGFGMEGDGADGGRGRRRGSRRSRGGGEEN
ncbi:hypothetical protein ACFL5Q_03195 [Planctomycetota bacterium]